MHFHISVPVCFFSFFFFKDISCGHQVLKDVWNRKGVIVVGYNIFSLVGVKPVSRETIPGIVIAK